MMKSPKKLNKHTKGSLNLKRKLIVLGIATLPLPSYAADSFWNNSTEDNQFFNENNWDTNTTPNLEGNLYINDTAGQTVELIFDDTNHTGVNGDSSSTLYIGSGTGNTADIEIDYQRDDDSNSSYPGDAYIAGSMAVGTNGGKGTVTYEYDRERSARIQLYGSLNIGSGLNSNGTVTLIGSGKTSAEQFMSYSALTTSALHIGTNGGTGTLNIDGSSIQSDDQYYQGEPDRYAFSLGNGLNNGVRSNGTMNVLNGGKAAIALQAIYEDTSSIIGHDGGYGTLNVSGTKVENGEFLQSRIYFGNGLEVGNGNGSIGSINVLNGGLLNTMSPRINYDSNTSAYLGINGGNGSVLVSGAGSIWQVSGRTEVQAEIPAEYNEIGELHIGESGIGNLTIANAGIVSIGRTGYEYNQNGNGGGGVSPIFDNSILGKVYLGVQTNGTGTLNFGAAEGQAAQAVGTLEAKSVIFGAGQGSVVFNHTDQTGNYSFDTELVSSTAGQGTIKNINGVTLFNTDQTNFSGKTDIVGGTFVANSTLGGTVSVSSQGTLAGIGSVGSTTLHSGGNIAPGEYGSSAPATLTIDGDLTTQAGSTYTTNITTDTSLASPYVADVILVNGDAYLNGGTIKPVASGDFTLYTEGSRWKILEATGSVIGQFDGVQKLAFVNLTHDYDPQNVYLVVTRNSVGFCTEGMTDNQCSVGKDIEEQGDGDIYDLITSQQTIEDAKNAFDQLSGEIHASAKGALLEDSRFLREAINKRLQSSSNGVWVHTFGSWGKFKGNDNAADLKRDIGGFFLGADKQLGEQWQVGFMGGYSRAELDVDNRHSNADRDDAHIGVYTQGQWGNASVRLGAGHSWHDFSTTRNIEFPGLKDRVTANYDAQTTQVFAEGSYKFQVGKTTELEPFVSGAYVHLKTDGFTEKGGVAKLMSDADKSDIFFSTIGTKATHQFELGKGQPAKVWAKAGWRHAFNQKDTVANLSFQSSGKGFEVKGPPIEKNTAALEFGMEASLSKNTNIGLMYNGQIGADTQDHGAKVYFNWVF
ncbi:autotransporter outer membrane beta-barrel domain-containing protein [Neisseria sp. Ec49-e6-T10]|uniref:autotransporter outer membrane beta-barrel domain-containing protein n=1 Tax=Neisseria sp. Ec49-e6-T10 TaxID=3140744 RepID=UPI003EC0CCB9